MPSVVALRAGCRRTTATDKSSSRTSEKGGGGAVVDEWQICGLGVRFTCLLRPLAKRSSYINNNHPAAPLFDALYSIFKLGSSAADKKRTGQIGRRRPPPAADYLAKRAKSASARASLRWRTTTRAILIVTVSRRLDLFGVHGSRLACQRRPSCRRRRRVVAMHQRPTEAIEVCSCCSFRRVRSINVLVRVAICKTIK